MKKMTKALLLLALAFFLSGAALGIASLCAGFSYREFVQNIEDGKFILVDSEKWGGKVLSGLSTLPKAAEAGKRFEETYTGVRGLKLQAGRADCEIIPYDGQEWKVKGERLASWFDCSMDGDALCIDCGGSAWNFPWIGKNGTAKLELYVPQDQILEEVEIETGVGIVQTSGEEGFLRCRILDLECGAGETKIRADVRETARIEGGVGEIRMTLAGKPDDFNYDVECGVGSIRIDGESYSGLGREHKLDNDAGKELRAECGVGSVELMFEEEKESSPEHHEEEQQFDHH